MFLAEPAPGVRGRLIARFAPNTKIRVRSLDDVRKMPEKSIDLVVMNSVVQYMTPAEFDAALVNIRRILKPSGRLVLGDVLKPEVGMFSDVLALLRFAAKHGFLKDALKGLASSALSDYRQLRTRVGLQRYSEDDIAIKFGEFGLHRLARAFQHRPQSVANDFCRAAGARTGLTRRLGLTPPWDDRLPARWAMIALARWRKRRREDGATSFILVQIQAGSPAFAAPLLRLGRPADGGCYAAARFLTETVSCFSDLRRFVAGHV